MREGAPHALVSEEAGSIAPALQEKWGIGIINLYHELPVGAIGEQTLAEYTLDGIHPIRRGYLEWWMPQIAADIESYMGELV